MANEIKIKELTSLLTQDSYYRKLQKWPLLKLNDIYFEKRNVNDVFSIQQYGREIKSNCIKRFNNNIKNYHTYVTDLLIKFRGHVVACGKESRGTPNWNLWF